MLITSDFHDYYDRAIGFGGVDKSIVYNRNEKIVHPYGDWVAGRLRKCEDPRVAKVINLGIYNFSPIETKYHKLTGFVVVFCGQLYPGVSVERKYQRDNTPLIHPYRKKDPNVDHFYDVESLFKRDNLSTIMGLQKWNKVSDYVKIVKRFFAQQKDCKDVCIELGMPVFLLDDRLGYRYYEEIYFNPCLKVFEFFKVKDPFQAFQDIAMFISGVLGTGNPQVVTVEDKYLAASKGFDKWSFRKPPKGV